MGVLFTEVPSTKQEPTGFSCDRCGAEVPSHWWFAPREWVHLKWGGDPVYSAEELICDKCATCLTK